MAIAESAQPATIAPEVAAEKAKLQKHFGRMDIFFFLVCTLVGVDGLGTFAIYGGAGFSWLLVCVVLFAIPSAMVLAELGASFTDEGGPYVWVRMAFGHLAGAVNNFFYWVTNPVWMGGTLAGTAIGGLIVFFHGGNEYGKTAYLVIGIPFIWLGVLFAVLSFRVGKWVATIGAIARFLLLGFFSAVVVAYGAKNGFHGIGAGGFKPTYQSFVLLVPLTLFSLVGFELPSAAGEEMEDAKDDVPAGIAKSVLATALLYGLPILGILLVLPAGQATGLAGFPDAIKQTLTVFGGHTSPAGHGLVSSHLSTFGTVLGWIMGVLIAVVAFTSGLTWIMGSDRTLAVSCYDGAGPRYFGRFSARFGTPLRVNVLSGVISTGIFVATLYITDGNAAKFFNVALALAISTTLISYIGIFPAAWKLRSQRPADDSYRAPLLPLMTVLSLAFVVFSTVEVLFPGLGDDWFGASYRPDDWKASEKWIYLLTEAVPLLLFTAIAVVFWAMGKRHRDAEIDQLAATPSPSTLNETV